MSENINILEAKLVHWNKISLLCVTVFYPLNLMHSQVNSNEKSVETEKQPKQYP